jgi:fatty acid desaturase
MNQPTPSNKFRIPTFGLIAIIGLLATLVAIFVFKVSLITVLTYGLVVAMMLSHFWMHAGHGNHNDHQEHTDSTNPSNSLNPVPVENNDQSHRSHGCH